MIRKYRNLQEGCNRDEWPEKKKGGGGGGGVIGLDEIKGLGSGWPSTVYSER